MRWGILPRCCGCGLRGIGKVRCFRPCSGLLSFGCVRRDAILRGYLLLGDFRLCELIAFAGRFGFLTVTQHAAICYAGTCVGEDFARVGGALSRSRWLWRRSWCRYRFGCWGGWFCRSFLYRLGGLADLIGWRGGLLR